jgi:hypothetical protein
LKSMKVNFSIFPGQHSHHIWTYWTIVVSFGDSSEELIPTSNISKPGEDVLQENWYKIVLEAGQNLYKFIPRRIAAVLKAKGGPAPYYE